MPDSKLTAAKTSPEQPEATPEDVATLYSWANLHGAKYRDFSSTRAQAREEARLRAEEAKAAERRRMAEEAERKAQEEAQIAARLAAEAAEAARQAEAERLAEIARQAEAERQAVLAAQEAQRQAAEQRGWDPSRPETYQGRDPFSAAPAPFSTEAIKPIPADPLEAEYGFQAAPEKHQSASRAEAGWATPVLSSFAAPAQHASSNPLYFAAQFPQSGTGAAGAGGHDRPQQGRIETTLTSAASSAIHSPGPAIAFAEAPYVAPNLALHSDRNSSWQDYDRNDRYEQADSREVLSRPAWLTTEPAAPVATHAPSGAGSSRAASPYSQSFSPAQAQNQVPMYSQGPVPTASTPQNAWQPPSYSGGQAQERAASFGSGAGIGAGSMHPTPQNSSPQNPGPQNPGSPAPASVDDTLVGTRDRLTNRWYALKSVFDPQSAPQEQVPAQPPARVPVLAVFSLAGGVGKTSLVASLGRALSSRGERVLLVDTAAYGLLPFFFGARDQRPGMLRTFNPPGPSVEAPIQLVTLDPEGHPGDQSGIEGGSSFYGSGNQVGMPQGAGSPQAGYDADWLAQEVGRYSRGANRVLVDLPTASGSTTRRVLRLAPVVLVPVVPDMNSVVSVGAIEAFFRNSASLSSAPGSKPNMPYYVLNQFDYSLPLHLDVREILREQIGDRLLPFALRRSPAVSEALAEGMTVMDYAPGAVVAEDYASLAGWVRSLSAPATQSHRGVRWSER